MNRIGDLFDREELEHERSATVINLHGISFSEQTSRTTPTITVQIDPSAIDIALPIVERSIREVNLASMLGTKIRLQFTPTVTCLEARHRITGRVYGTDVKLAPGDSLVRGDIKFDVGRLHWWGQGVRPEPAYINMEVLCDRIPSDQISELLSLLFERGILFLGPDVLRYNDYE